MPFEVRFRGRPAQEWGLLAIFMTAVWFVSDQILGVCSVVGPLVGLLDGIGYVVAHYGVTWFASSWPAGWVYRHLIDSDRNLNYLATTIESELQRWAWARGPINGRVGLVASPLWLAVAKAVAVTRLSGPICWTVALMVAWPAARGLTAAWESSRSTWTRQVTHAGRQPTGRALIVGDARETA